MLLTLNSLWMRGQLIDNVCLRRSQRTRRPAVSDDYVVYLQEHEFSVGMSVDPSTFQEATNGPQSSH
jgi:hypothetical protein